jgi:hypothetical protein
MSVEDFTSIYVFLILPCLIIKVTSDYGALLYQFRGRRSYERDLRRAVHGVRKW